jgi:hypothetical protein
MKNWRSSGTATLGIDVNQTTPSIQLCPFHIKHKLISERENNRDNKKNNNTYRIRRTERTREKADMMM